MISRICSAGNHLLSWFSLVLVLEFACPVQGLQIDTLLAKESTWKYYAGSSYPDPDWSDPSYDDSSWPTGPGILGYGESYVATTIPYGPDPSNKYLTTCFRITFSIDEAVSADARLILDANYDDGFVAYLNGTEIARRGLPDGPVAYGTLAASHESGGYEQVDMSAAIPDLIIGDNVLAVEVHQRNGSSSDLAWDAELLADNTLIQFIWSGGITDSSARVTAKLIPDSVEIRLAISTDPGFAQVLYSAADSAIEERNNRVLSFGADNLDPDQAYYYTLEVDGILQTEPTGSFRTFPQGEASFTFAFASCARTGSDHQVFETINQLDPLFFFHTGDFHYLNIGVNDPAVFRQAYETVLASPRQSRLYRDHPIIYIWDDHDFGPNNSDSTAPGREASRLTYRQYVPHYPLAAGDGDAPIYFAFTVGRVRFVVCDMRSARSPASAPDTPEKTMMGETQKTWFKQEMEAAAANFPLVVWVNSLPWIGVTGDDGWYLYTYEREEIANFLAAHDIDNLCMISGDAHMLAIDDGSNNDYATVGSASFPVMQAAALDQTGSVKGGPYSEGAYPGPGQFGLMTVTDFADSIRVDWSGRNYLNEEIVAYSFVVDASSYTDVSDEGNDPIPARSALYQNRPNPFNPSTTIRFTLSRAADVSLTIYNILGSEVKTLMRRRLLAGDHELIWNGTDKEGRAVASGIYFYRLIAGDFRESKAMVLIR